MERDRDDDFTVSKRGGDLVCRNLGQRVEIGGQAASYLVGEISL